MCATYIMRWREYKMFILKIHVVDTREPLHTTSGDSSSAANPSPKRTPIILMGVAHLFRQLPSATHPVVTTAGTTRVFVVAVPNYLSENDFVVSCGTHVRNFVDIIFLKNDGMEDRYSVLITLENQLAADEFHRSHNGKRFKPCEGEVCHIYFAQSVQYTKSEEISTLPPPDYTELPSCPVCLERLVYVKGHASEHWQKKQHQFAVEVGRERIWDYFRDLYVGEKSYSNSTDEIVDLHTRRLMSEVEIQQQRVVNACIHSLTNELDNIMWRQIMAKKSIQQEDEIEYLKASSSLLHEENINLRASNDHMEKENLRALNDYLLKEIHKVRSDLDAEKKLRESLEAEKKQRDSWESWD
ncbi:hypothetical protein OROMI_017188 [Orobanche minor]